MNLKNREPVIILIAGKARSGKSTVAEYIRRELEDEHKDVIISPYTKYLKQYISDITKIEVTDENKPREMLQKLSSDLIKGKLGYHDFFIRRQIEDINIYSYFMDYILVPDVRFPDEIEVIRNRFKNVKTIRVIREYYVSDLTEAQKRDITEVALDDYDDYDYIINNTDDINLEDESLKILEQIEKRGRL